MKYVEWIEPFDNELPQLTLYCRLSVEDVIKWQKLRCDRLHVYETDQQALDDFITVHWGEIKEYE